jgi:hypothetical protein
LGFCKDIEQALSGFQALGNDYSLSTGILKPNETKKMNWGALGVWKSSAITGIKVTFENGRTIEFNEQETFVMRADKGYNAGSRVILERLQIEIAKKTENPQADPSVYLEKPLAYVAAGNLTIQDAFYRNIDGRLSFKFASDAYIEYYNHGDSYLYDDAGNKIAFSTLTDDFRQIIGNIYRINENSDFDPNKKYRVNYVVEEVYKGLWVGIGYIIRIDSIEGLLTYDEAKAKHDAEKAERTRLELAKKKEETELAYEAALMLSGVTGITEYIQQYNTYDRRDYFNKDSYAEIARRITSNRNIKFDNITTSINPYAFNTETVYYCVGLYVNQFLNGKIIASLNSSVRNDENLIVVDSVPDISKIGRSIRNAYLRYTGVTKLSMGNGGTREVATFSVIFYF